ncbi:uncharacterized protein LOC133884934 isoform X2 [Phragmites australis]|uniref:uncharacterized protein LOC133884934 isoform X2 n=1 Tax=Phragmites australis TaxID=29695 RepID=UPI002D79ACCE|nr:uncharacterized protein LOC133884934 isoform X2 [Phragmites australis]
MDAARRERRHHRKAAAVAAGGVAAGKVGGGGEAAAAAARAAYGDVFGGPPRFAAPFGGAPLDYAEVFGGVAATCSIPYLHLPPAAAVGGDDGFFGRGGKGDYGEIFGRFDFADFAVPYEDLFGEPEPEREEIASSSGSSRSSIKKESTELEAEPPILPQHYQNLDHRQHFKEHKFSPISFPPDTDGQQFVMSYNKNTERRPGDLVEMTTCTVEPSMGFVIDSRNLSHIPATNDVSRIDNGTVINGNNEKNPSSASMSARNPESDFVVDQKHQSPSWPPISGSVSANENHMNSDNHSTCRSGTPHDHAFLRVSDIDAQTQPVKVLLNKKESAAKGDINLVSRSFTPTSSAHTSLCSNMPQADKKADSAPLNADANPTSASAAMKEAMDFAEARLKAAKELLERKGDSFKLRKKPSHHRSTRSTEIKAPALVEVDTSEQKISVKIPSKEEKNPEDSLSDKHKKLSAARLDHFDDNGKRVLPLEKPQQTMQTCTESCQTSSKLEKLGNWRSGDEFYELTGDDQKCESDKATDEDDKCKRTSPITSLSGDKKIETEFSAADSDLDRYEKLWEVNDVRDVGVKHVNLRKDNTSSVDRDRGSVILEASTESTANQEIHNSNVEGLVTLENAKESHDDECVELPSMNDTLTKQDFIKDMPDSLSEACSSGNHASDLRNLCNSSPKVSPVAATSQEHTNSKLVLEVPCDGEVQCTSGSSEKSQEPPEVSNADISQGSNIKSLILEELEGSYVCDAFPRGPSRVEQEAETYGREKFSFICESLLHNEDTKIKEVLSEEVEKVKIEEKVGPCAHPEVTVVDLDAECPDEEIDITLQNNLADHEEPNMLNLFEVASKLIKRDLDQEMRGSLGHGEVENGMQEGPDELISDSEGKEAEETPLENSERTGPEEGSAHGNQEDQKSSESTNRGQSDVDAKFNTTVDEVGSESFSGATSDSTTRVTINSEDEPASSSEMYTHMQHSTQKDESTTSQTPNRSVPGLEIGEVCDGGERVLPTERSTCEERKSRAEQMEEKDTTARISKAEHGPSPLEKSHSLPKSAEGPTPVSAETLRKEALGVLRAKERENITRAESASEKDKGSSRRIDEAKESERRLDKERELAEEKERRKLEEEERERERKKDRLAVERATREAHERAFAEAREKAEKMASERNTAARQQAPAEAREKEERASAEAAAERARLRAERAAVERATAEARERAIEKAKADKALAEARERRERYRSSLKESFKSTNQDIRQETQFQRATSSNFIRNPDSINKVVEVESALRHKARLERHQRTSERVTKALAEKNMRDLLAQREQAEKHRLSEFLDPEIKRWSNGKEGNLRALLSTLQYILGADSGWQPVPLTDLITAAAVKKAYRKATLCVHPDKLQQRGATIKQKYICEKVFDLLKDAWNKFNSEER